MYIYINIWIEKKKGYYNNNYKYFGLKFFCEWNIFRGFIFIFM